MYIIQHLTAVLRKLVRFKLAVSPNTGDVFLYSRLPVKLFHLLQNVRPVHHIQVLVYSISLSLYLNDFAY